MSTRNTIGKRIFAVALMVMAVISVMLLSVLAASGSVENDTPAGASGGVYVPSGEQTEGVAVHISPAKIHGQRFGVHRNPV